MKIGIDVATSHSKNLIRRLGRLKSTISVSFGGEYYTDKFFCQVHVETNMTESEMDDWLWRTKGIEYVGTFSREDVE